MDSTPTTPDIWRRRMQALARNAGPAHPPLFAPMLFGVAAQIEALEPAEMALDATRLRKNVGELQRLLGTDTVFCAVPSLMEAAALGVPVNEAVWPPLQGDQSAGELRADIDMTSPRIAASLGAVRQWQGGSGVVVVAALTGPLTLLEQLRAAGSSLGEADGLDFAGRALAALVRAYGEAGVHIIQLHETAWPAARSLESWRAALGTINNVARFFKMPPVLVAPGNTASEWPATSVPCLPTGTVFARQHAWLCASAPQGWTPLPRNAENVRFVTSCDEVFQKIPIAELMAGTARMRFA